MHRSSSEPWLQTKKLGQSGLLYLSTTSPLKKWAWMGILKPADLHSQWAACCYFQSVMSLLFTSSLHVTCWYKLQASDSAVDGHCTLCGISREQWRWSIHGSTDSLWQRAAKVTEGTERAQTGWLALSLLHHISRSSVLLSSGLCGIWAPFRCWKLLQVSAKSKVLKFHIHSVHKWFHIGSQAPGKCL